jgi:hypothetical protein
MPAKGPENSKEMGLGSFQKTQRLKKEVAFCPIIL